MKKKKLWLWLIAGALVVGLLVMTFSKEPVTEAELVQTEWGSVTEFILEEGKTRLEHDHLVTMPLDGRVFPNRWHEGQQVQQGERLARIDLYGKGQQIRGLQARLNEINALLKGVDVLRPKPEDLASARVRIQEARLQWQQSQQRQASQQVQMAHLQREAQRQAQLFKQAVVPQTSRDESQKMPPWRVKREQARQQVSVAYKAVQQAELAWRKLYNSLHDQDAQRQAYRAQLQQVQAQINQLHADMGHSQVSAPVTGAILEIFVRDEAFLSAGSRLLRLGDMDSITVESDLLSEDIPRVKVNMPVELSGRALGEKKYSKAKWSGFFPQGFTKVSSFGVEQQRFKVIVRFDNHSLRLRPGMRLDVKILTAHQARVVRVPERALFKVDNRWHVFVIEEEHAVLRPVQIGLKNEDVVEVLKGLKPGELIILAPDNHLKAGSKIKALERVL